MLEFILTHLHRDEEGQTMAEYAVVLAVITVAIIGTLGVLSGKVNSALAAVGSAI